MPQTASSIYRNVAFCGWCRLIHKLEGVIPERRPVFKIPLNLSAEAVGIELNKGHKQEP